MADMIPASAPKRKRKTIKADPALEFEMAPKTVPAEPEVQVVQPEEQIVIHDEAPTDPYKGARRVVKNSNGTTEVDW